MAAGAEELKLAAARYGVALSWDHTGSHLDVDLQAVIIDDRGTVIDAVYYNNLKALGCVTHSGDETSGERAGFDEVIWVSTTKIPPNVKMVVFVVAAYHGGHLRDAVNGRITILEESASNVAATYALEGSAEEVDAVACMVRQDGGWKLTQVHEGAVDGQHFIDVLEPVIGKIVRSVMPGAPKRLKAAFAMEKGMVVELPMTSKLGTIKAGLGWDMSRGKVDLDVSAVLFDETGYARNSVSYKNLSAPGVSHSGDDRTGWGRGDDETITINFDTVEPWVVQVFFVITIYTQGKTFAGVANPYCRVIESSGSELARFNLRESGASSALVMARFFRDGARWGFQAIGAFCEGRTWNDTVPTLQGVFRMSAVELQSRGVHSLPGQHAADAAPPAPPDAACCSLQ